MFVTFLDVVIGGLLLGGIFALIAVGLSLQYGVAHVLNISHGEFIMLGAFITWAMFTGFGVSPLISLFVIGPVLFGLGFIIHKVLFRRLRIKSESVGAFEASSLLASFGLLFIIQNLAIMTWGAGIQGYTYLAFPVNIGGAVFGANRLVTLFFALLIGVIFYLFIARTRLGKAIRAAAQDPAMAGIMGVNIDHVLALVFGFGAMLAGLAGSLLSMTISLNVAMGLPFTIIAIIVVVLGGLGSIPGSFIGGFLLGLVGNIVTYLDPGLALVAYYAIFMLLLIVRPTGILGR